MQVRLHGSRGVSSVATDPPGTPVAPCIIIITIIIIRKGEDRRKKKREVLHLFRCYTHTHPAGAGSTLKGKRKKKADTDDGQKAKTAQGGEGNRRTSKTNLHGETDLTKTERTPKPHDTLRRGTRGELGTSWWQTRETKTISLKTELSP